MLPQKPNMDAINAENRRVKEELIKTTDAIRKKFKTLKQGRIQEELELEKAYKPIITPLNKLVKLEDDKAAKQKQHTVITNSPIKPATYLATTPSLSPPLPYNPPSTHFKQKLPSFVNMIPITKYSPSPATSPKIDSHESLAETAHSIPPQVVDEYLEQYDMLPRQYLEKMILDTTDVFDRKYGVHHNAETEKWKIGDTDIDIIGPDIKIGDKLFQGTPGLYELIFMKEPKTFNSKDQQTYKEILEITHAHRKNYNPLNQISGNRGYKYNQIIRPLVLKDSAFEKEGAVQYRRRVHSVESPRRDRSGMGMAKVVNNRPVEYVYWNTPTELVARLRLLYSSKMAGHTGHDNEIASIIEELREEGIIE